MTGPHQEILVQYRLTRQTAINVSVAGTTRLMWASRNGSPLFASAVLRRWKRLNVRKQLPRLRENSAIQRTTQVVRICRLGRVACPRSLEITHFIDHLMGPRRD